eukprot:2048-Heterococcus_DN1.PRE.1
MLIAGGVKARPLWQQHQAHMSDNRVLLQQQLCRCAVLISSSERFGGVRFCDSCYKRGRSQHIEEPNSKPPTPLLRVQKVVAQLIAPSVASDTVASSRKSKNSPLHLQCSSWSDVLLRAYLSSQPWCADSLQAKTSTTKLFSSLR